MKKTAAYLTKNLNTCKAFRVRNPEKWRHQNNAHTLDYYEGSLIDNFLLGCKRGFCAVYECYVNSNMSEHLYIFVPYDDETSCKELVNQFTDRRREYCEYCDC